MVINGYVCHVFVPCFSSAEFPGFVIAPAGMSHELKNVVFVVLTGVLSSFLHRDHLASWPKSHGKVGKCIGKCRKKRLSCQNDEEFKTSIMEYQQTRLCSRFDRYRRDCNPNQAETSALKGRLR
jgi:hypothetical protein